MSQLSDRSITRLCMETRLFGFVQQIPMIQPFSEDKVITNGKSHGLSCASYDVRIAHDLVLGTIIDSVRYDIMNIGIDHPSVSSDAPPPYFALANTLEDFNMPHNVSGSVVDKSSYARLFTSAFNTFIDPGFVGNLTLELVNLGDKPIHIKEGDPICQIVFNWIDRKVRNPYNGKYSKQARRPVGLREEFYDGSYKESDYGKRLP